MIEKFLKDFNQLHLLKEIKKFSKKERSDFLNQIKSFSKKEIKKQFFYRKFGPSLKQDKKYCVLKSSFQNSDKYKKRGKKIVFDGKVAVVFLSGGVGSRLNFHMPKGLFPIIENKTLFEIFIEKIKNKCKTRPYIIIMVSLKTKKEILSFFKKKEFFGLKNILFLCQHELPVLDKKGKWILKEKKIVTSPNGNGAFFELFKKNLLKKLKQSQIKYLHVLPIDNPLFDPFHFNLIGFHDAKRLDVTVACIKSKKNINNMGGFVLDNKQIKVLEYFENKKQIFKFLNIGVYVISLSFIEKMNFNLPYHTVKKRDIFKSEKFIFDGFNTKKIETLCFKKNCFAPLKRKKDILKLKKLLKK